MWAPDPLSSASIHDVVRALLKVMEKAGSVSAERVRDTLQCLGRKFKREEFANVSKEMTADVLRQMKSCTGASPPASACPPTRSPSRTPPPPRSPSAPRPPSPAAPRVSPML